MSTINDRIDLFISVNNLSDTQEFRTALGDFVAGCWQDHFKICQNEQIPEDKYSSKKVSKAEKIENPSECKDRDDLRNCTSGTLNEFCKNHGLRVGGNKKEVMDRVWRHLQGNNSEEDISPRTKPKKDKKINEKHDCYGCTSKGTPCAVAATVEVDGCWFCWRHEESAQEIIANKKGYSNNIVSNDKESNKGSKKISKKSDEELYINNSDTGTKKKKTNVKVLLKNKKKEESEGEEDNDEEELETDEE
jgi:hypothetical protein